MEKAARASRMALMGLATRIVGSPRERRRDLRRDASRNVGRPLLLEF